MTRWTFAPVALALALACSSGQTPAGGAAPPDAGTAANADGSTRVDPSGNPATGSGEPDGSAGVPGSGSGGASGSGPSGPDGDGDGVPDGSDNCPETANPDQFDFDDDGAGDPCDPDPPKKTCGDEEATFSRGEPNVLIILDKSGSMDNDNKWTQATDALDSVATNLANDIRFGLALFPGLSGDECAEPTLALPMGSHTTAEIQGSYAGVNPGGRTPMALALDTALQQDWVSDPGDPEDAQRSKVVVLITDGQPNCGAGDPQMDDPQGAIDAAQAFADADIPVYVVGFGAGVDADTLNDIAAAGGTDNPSDPTDRYFQADNGMELEDALLEIGALVASCDLSLGSMPPDPTRVYVLLDGTPLVRDDPDGWRYDAAGNRVRLRGNACDTLRNSASPDFQVIFGCPAETPPGTGGSGGAGGAGSGGNGGSGGAGGDMCPTPICPADVQPCGVSCLPACPAAFECVSGCCATLG